MMKATSLLTLTLTLAAALVARAQMTTFAAQPSGSKVKIDGTSTIHDWTIEGGIIAGTLELDSSFVADPTKAKPGKVPAKVEITIPVRTLKSGKTTMDNVTYQAMSQTNFPRIHYILSELTLKETPKSADGPYNFDSKGQLVIKGTTNAVSFPVTMTRSGKALRTMGVYKLKMTDYKVPPPAPSLLGLSIKTGDQVTLTWDWATQQK
ncbi:MAG TPA: YceI family protein [Candidatus Acidoferrum sp.]|nr:YceI family protein [Candidatus Acidoferrum sp.]